MTAHPTDYGPEPSVSGLQAQIFRLEGEIERLRAMRDFIKDTPCSEPNDGWATEVREQPLRQMDVAQRALVNATIERCAQVAEALAHINGEAGRHTQNQIAAAIRTLKDKP